VKFKIRGTEFTLSFTFLALFLILACVGEVKLCLFSFISSLLHETVHIAFILILGGNVKAVTLTAFGANIVRGEKSVSSLKEALISLSAPVFNLILGGLFYKTLPLFSLVNSGIGLFNLLPFYDFDGGRGLSFLLESIVESYKINRLLDVTAVLVTFLFTFISVYFCFKFKMNLTLVLLSVYMIFKLFVRLKPNVKNSYKY
jgi:Zn-dependent protease